MRSSFWGLVTLLFMTSQLAMAAPTVLSSPDRRLQVTFDVSPAGEPHYSIQRSGEASVGSSHACGCPREIVLELAAAR